MKLILIGMMIFLAGCGNQARMEYYAAVQAAAEAQSRESEARYNALASMARSSDPGSSTAAVMAIALSQKPTIQPQYIEDDSLKWAQILAGPLTAVASLAIQADLSRDTNRSNQKVAIARINSDAATDQALYAALTAPTAPPPPSLGVDGLGVVVDGLVTLGTSGISGVGDMGALGINSVVGTASTGYQTIEEIVGKSYMTIESIAEDCGGCGSCFVCEPVDPPVTVTVTDCGDGQLAVSPAVCPAN